ncbi:leucine--tRNA ligase [Candidatus Micrarchaeota archaeon]|nr:leucine--tRNA ligase [Candidatus Micrarchaeota archaeon]
MDATAIEAKWSRRWAEAHAFESDPAPGREKRYITAAFPYPNSPQHIGHGRTYTTADIYSRYLRLKGYHVLFPMAFHVTGTPILAMAKRIAARDPDVLGVFERIYGILPEKAATLSEPRALVSYFSDEIESGMKEIGYSIDWRRKFYSYDERFNRFIQWQFRKLKELGYLIKGEYPIAWCPADKNAVSAHDTRGDVDPELEDVTVIKFAVAGTGEPVSLVVTTYRPETVYGVTNIWVNPEAEYVRARHKGEIVLISKKAAEVLDLQLGLEIIGPIPADEILKMKAVNPMTNETVPVYRAGFVSAEIGTGIVMSVPAHAPLDYLALRDLGLGGIPMPQVVSLKGYGPAPARDIVEKMGVKGQLDPLSEKATEEIYTKEAHDGVMVVGRYIGQKAMDAKVKIAEDLRSHGKAFNIVTLGNGPIFCRCGSHVVVNILKDQWFIDYGVPEWKAKAKECLEGMNIVPADTRGEYLYTIDWFKTRPSTRAAGLGTKFPFDESKMIEALSDSTIYMAYYTIAHMLKEMPAGEMDEDFFDAVFLGKGPKAGDAKLAALRNSFLYWYPVDSRHSAGDLIRNHLTLYIFNHVGIFPDKSLWPRQIVTNGFVLMDGSKMSKSMGNILPLRKAIKEYGADVIRFSVVCGADLSSDTDFNRSVADGVRSRMALIDKLMQAAKYGTAKPHGRIERWLLSRLNRKIERADKLYFELAIRDLALEIFYEVTSDLQWYMKRSSEPNLRDFFEKWVVLIAPFMPHYCEEYWEMLGGKGFVSFAPFPKPDHAKIDDSIERGEELIRKVHADIEKISGLIGKKPAKVTIYIAAEWKRDLYNLARENPKIDLFMKAAAAKKMDMKAVSALSKGIMKNVHSLPAPIPQKDELDALNDAAGFLAKEYSCTVEVLPEEQPKHEKAKSALPDKPAIVIE